MQRTLKDRIRHALCFEIIGLVLVTPLGAVAFDIPFHDVGIVSAVSAAIATAWNFVYNYGFDQLAIRFRRTTEKTVALRIVHAVMFEVGLLIVLMPFIAWYLGVTLWQALIMDIAFAFFYMIYAYLFNWAYDRLYPLPEWQTS